MLVACTQPVAVPEAPPQTAAFEAHHAPPPGVGERVLYSFASGKDGAYPEAPPISINGELYGSTFLGGNGNCAIDRGGCGAVYVVDASGQERLIHIFKGGEDGAYPLAALISDGGSLLGTTSAGGGSGCRRNHSSGCGTIFELKANKERVLYRFPGGALGASPRSPLTLSKGLLYGEAAAGGNAKCPRGCGAIFKMTSSNHVSNVYAFRGGTDGGTPEGGLVFFGGTFYGTTSGGGSYACYFTGGCGTVFEVSPSGIESILHRFTGSPTDGALPESGLVVLNGALYGTTFSGGKYNCGFSYYLSCGTVFEVTTSGHERIVYNFRGEDGAFPNGLMALDGDLYGTTQNGGGGCKIFPGCGTVFKMTPSGQETVLYGFKGGGDGVNPGSSPIEADGTLRGTTIAGGHFGYGTVYALTP